MTYPRRPVEGLARIGSARRLDLAAIPEPPAWMGDALCAQVGPGDGPVSDAASMAQRYTGLHVNFFPSKGGSSRGAKKVCAGCDVRTQCLKFALDHDERFGVWGGLTERERRRLLRERAAS